MRWSIRKKWSPIDIRDDARLLKKSVDIEPVLSGCGALNRPLLRIRILSNTCSATGGAFGTSSLTIDRIQPNLVIVTDPLGNLTGVERSGFTDYTLIGLDLHFGTQAMGGWRGGQFTVGAAINFGNDLRTQDAGDTYPIQLASSGATL
jgi:hypothetical protein